MLKEFTASLKESVIVILAMPIVIFSVAYAPSVFAIVTHNLARMFHL